MVVAGITVAVVAIGGFRGLVGSDDVMNRLDNVEHDGHGIQLNHD